MSVQFFHAGWLLFKARVAGGEIDALRDLTIYNVVVWRLSYER